MRKNIKRKKIYRTKKRINELINSNVIYASKLASKFDKSDIEFDDLRSQAYVGLVEAANSFDFNRNIKFTSYAYSVITFKLIEYISRRGLLNIGQDSTRRKIMLGNKDLINKEQLNLREINSIYYELEKCNETYTIDNKIENNSIKYKINNYIESIDDIEKKNIISLLLQDYTLFEISRKLKIKYKDIDLIYDSIIIDMRYYLGVAV